jgi:uncharacterized membrane protein
MTDRLIWLATLLGALGCGLIAGVFFAFSAFVMRALARLPANEGVAAMQSINRVVINPVFMAAFLGTGGTCLLLLSGSLLAWHRPGSGWALLGSVLYLIGTIGVTMVCHVPRNNALAPLDPVSAEAADVWTRYLAEWTRWNHVRTVASLAAAAALAISAIRR